MKAISLFFYISLIFLLLLSNIDVVYDNRTELQEKKIQTSNKSLFNINYPNLYNQKQKNSQINDKTNITEYNIKISYYTFNNISELYLYCESDRSLPINFTFAITLEIKYRKIEYNEIEFWFESKFCRKIINIFAYKIYQFSNGTIEFYCNYQKLFNINETEKGYYIVYIQNITEALYNKYNKFYINYYAYYALVEADNYYNGISYNISYKDINYYKGLSTGVLVLLVIIILIVVFITIAFLSLYILGKRKKDKTKTEAIEAVVMPISTELNQSNSCDNNNLINVIENQILKTIYNPIIILFKINKVQDKLYILIEGDKTIEEITNMFINLKNINKNKNIEFKYDGNIIDKNCKIFVKDFFIQNNNKIVNVIDVEV